MTKNRQPQIETVGAVGVLLCLGWLLSNFRDVSFTMIPHLGNPSFDAALWDLFGVEFANGSFNENYWLMSRYHLPIQDAYMASLPNILIPFGILMLLFGVLIGVSLTRYIREEDP